MGDSISCYKKEEEEEAATVTPSNFLCDLNLNELVVNHQGKGWVYKPREESYMAILLHQDIMIKDDLKIIVSAQKLTQIRVKS